MKEKFYFVLYGEDAVNTLDNQGMKGLEKAIKDGALIYSVKKYDKSKDNVVTVLEDSDGFFGNCFISEEQYDIISNL